MMNAQAGWTSDRDSIRQLALERDERQCVQCGATQDLHVHHLVPRHLGGRDELPNLITLCSACHAARHPNLQVKLARRLLERWTVRIARLFDYGRHLPAEVDRLGIALRVLGKERFREGQLDVVLAALRGESVLAIRPTGSGKTLCFQVPALLRPGTTVVFVPLKALMADQVRSLHRSKIPGTFINSDLDRHEKKRRYELLERGAVKLLYLAPERLDPRRVRDRGEIQLLLQHRPTFMVVDEVHCVDRWGHDFRPSYGRLGYVRDQLGNPPVLAFTATAGKEMQQRILQMLGIPDARVFVSGVDRPNIALVRVHTGVESKRYRIVKQLVAEARKGKGKALLFVPTRKVGKRVQDGLAVLGLDLPFYHGELPEIKREDLLGRFCGSLEPPVDALICTNAFGMGIDVPNIRVVVHWVQPESVEDYVQECGRAGRDGKPALAVIFKAEGDIKLRQFMAKITIQAAEIDDEDRKELLWRKERAIQELDSMIRNREECFRRLLLAYFQGDKPGKRAWSLRILDWLFGERQEASRGRFCCDRCHPQRAADVLTDAGEAAGQVLFGA